MNFVQSCTKMAVMKRLAFPKSARLTSNEQFRAVLSQKNRFSNNLLTIYIAKNDCGRARLGVSVGKAFGNAVVRNRLKRLAREAFRQSQEQIPADFDYLLIFSQKLTKKQVSKLPAPTFEQVNKAFLELVARAMQKNRQ